MRLARVLRRLERLEYPATTDEILAGLGDDTLDLPEGEEDIRAVFERAGEDSCTCPDEAWLTLLSALSAAAVGRRGYSDRDPPVAGEYGGHAVSF